VNEHGHALHDYKFMLLPPCGFVNRALTMIKARYVSHNWKKPVTCYTK